MARAAAAGSRAGPAAHRRLAATAICGTLFLSAPVLAQKYPRVLSGEEIQLQQQAEQWETTADLNDGFRFRVTFFPDGGIVGTNVKGGGSMIGRWTVQVPEGRLCLQWQAQDWPPSACYKMVAMSQNVFDLLDPDTTKRVWHFKVLNF